MKMKLIAATKNKKRVKNLRALVYCFFSKAPKTNIDEAIEIIRIISTKSLGSIIVYIFSSPVSFGPLTLMFRNYLFLY
jgi:hypothetical protein